MKIENRAVRSTAIYFVGNVLSKIIVFFLLPIYTKYIPAADMGYYDTSVTVITLFSCVLFLDIGTTVMRFFLERKKEEGLRSVVTGGSCIFFLSSTAYFLLLLVFSAFLSFDNYIWIVFYGFLYALNDMTGYCTRAVGKNFDFAVAGVIQTLILATSNLVMIYLLEWGYVSLYISFCLSTVISCTYMFFRAKLYRYISAHAWDASLFREMLAFSLPLCVNSVAFWLLSSSSRVIVTYVLGTAAAGYLSIAGKFNQVLYLASTCVQLTWQEASFSHDNSDPETGKYYSQIYRSYLKGVMLCVALMIPAVKIGLAIFPSFIHENYAAAIPMIPTALIGTGLAIVSLFLGTVFSSVKKNSVIFLSTLLGAIVTVGSNLFCLLVLDLGPISANYALMLGYLSSISVRLILLNKYVSLKPSLDVWACILPLLILATLVFLRLGVVWNIIGFIGILVAGFFLFRKELRVLLERIRKKKGS